MTSSTGEHGTLIMIIIFFGMAAALFAGMPSTMFSNQGNTSDITYRQSFQIGSSEYKAGYYHNNITNDGATIWVTLTWRELNDTLLSFAWDPVGLAEGIWFRKPVSYYPYYDYYDPHPVTLSYVVGLNMGNTTTFWLHNPENELYNILCTVKTNSTYTTLTNSWNGGDLQLYLGYPQNVTLQTVSYDVWQVVGQIMSFHTPDVHPALNLIIGMTLWAPIIVAILYVLDKILPF